MESGEVCYPSVFDRADGAPCALRIIYWYKLPWEDGGGGVTPTTSELGESFAELLSGLPVASDRMQTAS